MPNDEDWFEDLAYLATALSDREEDDKRQEALLFLCDRYGFFCEHIAFFGAMGHLFGCGRDKILLALIQEHGEP